MDTKITAVIVAFLVLVICGLGWMIWDLRERINSDTERIKTLSEQIESEMGDLTPPDVPLPDPISQEVKTGPGKVPNSQQIEYYPRTNFKGIPTTPELYDVYKFASIDSNGIMKFDIKSINAPIGTVLAMYIIDPTTYTDSRPEYYRFWRFFRPIRNLELTLSLYPDLIAEVTGLSWKSKNLYMVIMPVPLEDVPELQQKRMEKCLSFNDKHPDLCNFQDPF